MAFKVRVRPAFCPGPQLGAHDAPRDPIFGWGGRPLPILHPSRRVDSPAFSTSIWGRIGSQIFFAKTLPDFVNENIYYL